MGQHKHDTPKEDRDGAWVSGISPRTTVRAAQHNYAFKKWVAENNVDWPAEPEQEETE